MRNGFDDLLGRAFVDVLWIAGIPREKRAMVCGALLAAYADRTRGPNAKARIIADAFHVDFTAVRRLVT